MGSRVGYRIRSGDEVSNIIRKQWQDYDIGEVVFGVAKTLMHNNISCTEATIGGGICALRRDLDIARMTASLYSVCYEPPFDSIEIDPLTCDITDNGLHEIELVKWNHWEVWHYPMGYYDTTLSEPELVAEVHFADGETFPDGMDYEEVS